MFVAHEIKLDKTHPCFPGQTFWKIFNLEKKSYGLGMYTSKEACEAQIIKKTMKV